MADVSVLLTLYMILTRECREQDLPCALQGSLSPKNNQSPTTRIEEHGKTEKGDLPSQKRAPGMDLDRPPSEALLPLLWSSQWSMCGYSVSLWR